MREEQYQHSEVARLLEQIQQEYEAAQRGLTGVASGVAQHTFITARMERMSILHNQLHDLVGDTSIELLSEQCDKERP